MALRVRPGEPTSPWLCGINSRPGCVAALAVVFLLSAFAGPVQAAPRVVVTIKPLHSLVSGVMEGVGTPDLLVQGSISPHLYSLRPSDIHTIDQGDLVVWIGAAVESFLFRHMKEVKRETAVVSPLNMHGVVLLSKRRGTRWGQNYDQIGGNIPDPTGVHTHVRNCQGPGRSARAPRPEKRRYLRPQW